MLERTKIVIQLVIMDIINVRLPNKLTADIDKLAKKHNLTRSEVMRQALTIYIHLTENVGDHAKTHSLPSKARSNNLHPKR